MIVEEMNAMQIKKVNSETVAILVIGACENHGDHLPFGADFIVPIDLAKRISKRIGNAIVFPAIPYGVSSHHSEFKMTMSLQPDTLVKIIEDLFQSLVRNKINKILVINGHDGNIAPIELAARVTKDKYPDVVIACIESWWVLVGEIRNDLFEVWNGLGHGGEAETSVMLAIRPDLVNMDLAPEVVIPKLPDNGVRIYWKFNELTNTGTTGSPKIATIKKGENALKSLEDALVSFVNEMKIHDWKYGLHIP
ncbi:MAG: creatininase family protein [Nitrososphaeraceae archaeon]|nr:creatininase family protein [Nitrososphaeraceae archaeon]